MRSSLLAFILLPSSFLFSQSVIRTLPWELDTARPALKEWSLVRGETADLECRYLAGASAMDVRGAAVTLHCRTNGMAAGYSFAVTGRVGRASSTNLAAVGWVTVRVRPGMDLPSDVKSCTFALETVLNSARNLVATGTLKLSGDPTGASPASVPLYLYDPAGSAAAVSNALAATLQTLCTPGALAAAVAPLATTTSVQSVRSDLIAEADRAIQAESSILSILSTPSTNHTTRIWSDAGTQYIDGTGGVWRIEQTTNLDPNRMLFVFSAGATIGGDTPPEGISLALGESVETNGISYYWDANGIGVVRYPSGWARNINVSAPTNIPAIGPGTYGICSNVYAFALEPVPYPRVAFVSDLAAPPLSAVVDAGGVATNPVTLTITNTAKYTGLKVTARGADSMGIEAYARGLAVLGKSTDGNGVSGTALGSGFGVTASGATGILAVASTSEVGIYTPNKIISGSGFIGPGSGLTNVAAISSVTVTGVQSNLIVTAVQPSVMSNAIAVLKEYHTDSFTNLIWRSVFSNGWHWLVASTNTP